MSTPNSSAASPEPPLSLAKPAIDETAAAMPVKPTTDRKASFLYWVAVIAVAFAGIWLRVSTSGQLKGVGFDEILYRAYVHVIDAQGFVNYDQATLAYVQRQSRPDAQAELPPTRVLYIFCGAAWKQIVYGSAPPVDLKSVKDAHLSDPALCSLRGVSKLFSILALLLAGVIGWRVAGRSAGLAALALMAFSPLQIHMSQHAMVDGVLSFWAMLALLGLWESLRCHRNGRWLAVYGVALACMVLTKENSFFVFVAICGLLIANHWGKWGTITPRILAVTFGAPALAVLLLVLVAGGFQNFFRTYQLLVTNAQNLDYAIRTGDGPWYRYLVDLMTMNPVVLCLAIAAALRTWREERWLGYMLGFIVFSFALMCNVRYGMNLRYSTIWELPLAMLAFAQLCWISGATGKWQSIALPTLVAAVCALELHQYVVFFTNAGLYELAPAELLHAVKMLK